jgi:hypothetical protein
MVRRRFERDTPFEYLQVIVDRRDPRRPTRRSEFRGGRRATDVPEAVLASAPGPQPSPAATGLLADAVVQPAAHAMHQ